MLSLHYFSDNHSRCPQSPAQHPSLNYSLLSINAIDAQPATSLTKTIQAFPYHNRHHTPPIHLNRTTFPQPRKSLPPLRRNNNLPNPRPRSERSRRWQGPRPTHRCRKYRQIPASLLRDAQQAIPKIRPLESSSPYNPALHPPLITSRPVPPTRERQCEHKEQRARSQETRSRPFCTRVKERGRGVS